MRDEHYRFSLQEIVFTFFFLFQLHYWIYNCVRVSFVLYSVPSQRKNSILFCLGDNHIKTKIRYPLWSIVAVGTSNNWCNACNKFEYINTLYHNNNSTIFTFLKYFFFFQNVNIIYTAWRIMSKTSNSITMVILFLSC